MDWARLPFSDFDEGRHAATMRTESLELEGRRLELLSPRLTQRFYDRTAPFYSVSSALWHSRAHRRLLQLAGDIEGQRVVEVATGSGELFRELVERNRSGMNVGFDLSPGMMAVVSKRVFGLVNARSPRGGRILLQAVNACEMPYRDASFDSMFNCYLFELLHAKDIDRVIHEFARVLRPGGKLYLVNIGDSSRFFNFIYGWLGYAVPSYWGRQVVKELPHILEHGGFRILHTEVVTQTTYPSQLTVAEKAP